MWLAFSVFPFYLFSIWKRSFLLIGLTLQSTYLIWRGLELGRLPLVGPHDTLTFLAASIVALSIPFWNRLKEHSSFFTGVAILAASFTVFALVSKQHNTPLPPVLKTIWFELHVVLAFLSYGLFGLGTILGFLYLQKLDNLLENMQYKVIFLGYCFFSLSMIFGGIWAFLAWGTYWLWTPKELWTAILWIFYTLYLHVRFRQNWMGKPSAILGIIGFGVTLFTYLGVSLLMKSSHSF